MRKNKSKKNVSLTLGIPAGRDVDWICRILSRLEKPVDNVDVLIARWRLKPLSNSDLKLLNQYLPTKQVLSDLRHAPAMRNSIIKKAKSTHILFIDDDMVPDPNLLNCAISSATQEPNYVYQAIPYYVANSDNWLARTEGKLYEAGFKSYIDKDGNVALLDARLMLAPTKILQEVLFDESLAHGGGEGRQLAKDLMQKGIRLRLGQELSGAHINRDTVKTLAAQKRAHGRGRGYQLAQNGPGPLGWRNYIATYIKRHFINPLGDRFRGQINTRELLYVWGTNIVFWSGVIEQMIRFKINPEK